MTDINNQNPTSDQDSRSVPSHSGAVQDYVPSAQLPVQSLGTLVDPLGVGKQSKGKRRGKKAATVQQDLAYADGQDQSANGKGEEKASGGGGGSSLLYVVGGLAVVGAGVALAGGGGSSPAPEAPKDTTAPTAPTVSLPTDTGISPTDRITSNGRIDVGGLETGATWEYSTNGGTNWQAGTGTNFTLSAGTYSDGAVLVRQKDAAGNVSATGKPAGAVTVDTTAPSAAVISQVAGDGIVSAAEKAAGVTLSGTGEAGSSVSVVWGTVTKTATVNTSGAWSVQFASTDVPADGATTVLVKLTDLAGNVSAEAQRAVTVDTSLLIQGNIVAGPLVAGHGLTVSIFTSAGTLLKSGVAVANDGSFSTQVAANLGDVLIAKVTDSSTGADYSDEATGAAKDLNAALFAAVIVSSLSAPVQAQVNPVTTLAAIKAGLSADGSGTISNAAAVQNANTLVAKALGLDTVNVAPVPTNGGNYAPADGLSSGEKLGAILAALSGLDATNAGDTQTSLTFLAAQIGVSGQAISADGLAAIINGAAAASLRTEGKLEAAISNLLTNTQQSASVSIDAIATDNVVSASELPGLAITGTVATGATSVALSVGSWSANAVVSGGTWSYTLSASDASALGADGAKILVATAVLEQGQAVTSSRAILLDTAAPVATIDMISENDRVNAAEKLAGVVISGTAEAKSSILLTWGGVEFSTQANLAGNWTLAVPSAQVPASGNTTVSIIATDVNNNAGQAVTRNVTVDTTLPSKPEIFAVSSDDNISSVEASKPFVLKGTAELGAKVALLWGGTDEYTGDVGEDGIWSITIPSNVVPQPGSSQIKAYVIDAAGNRSDTSSRDVKIYGVLTQPIIFPIAFDNQVNSAESIAGVVVSGLAPPMSLVRLTWGGTQTVKADDNGNWSVSFGLTDLPIDGPWTVLAELVDEFDVPLGPTQKSELPIVIDTIAPNQAVLGALAQDNIVNAKEKVDGIKVSGSAEAFSKITLTWGSLTRSATANSDMSWEIDLLPGDIPVDGTAPLEVVATDAAGNISVVNSQGIKVDTILPDVPQLAFRADTGIKNNDNITSDGVLLLTGIGSDATWSYSFDSGENWLVGGTAANAQLPLGPGEYDIGQIQIRQADAAGNVSAVFATKAQIIVDIAAVPISVDSITENLGSTAIVNADEKSEGVTISGAFEPFSTIAVNWNGIIKSPIGTADDEGNWSVTFDASEIPADGSTSVIVTGKDVAGNISQKTVNVVVDTLKPDALSVGLFSDTNIPDDGITRNPKITVTGFETNSSWEYSVNNGQTWEDGNSILNGVSSFELSDASYASGAIRVRQVDVAGNVGAETPLNRNLVVDTVAEGLTINVVAGDGIVNLTERNGSVAVSGQAEVGANVAVTIAGVTTPAEKGASGLWTVNYASLANLADGEYQISVVQTDLAGNVSAPVTSIFTIDTTPPTNPTLAAVTGDNKINAADITAGLTLSGTAVANGKVRLNWGTGDVLVDVDGEGNWSTPWDLAKLPDDGSRTLSVTAINTIGNVSQTVDQIVTIDRQVLPPTVESIATDGKVNAAEKAQGITVTGLAEAGASVTIVWGISSKTVIAALNGEWRTYFGPTEIPADGLTTMILSQTDVLGNASTQLIVKPIVDSGLPATPTISAITSDDILIPIERAGKVFVSGTGEANQKVIVTFGGVSEEVTVGPQNTWTAEFVGSALPASGDAQVTAQVKDSAGNLSEIADRTVTFVSGEVTVPIIGVISVDNAINAAEKPSGVRISGLAAANDVVVVQIGTSAPKSFTTGLSGAWTVSFAASELPVDGTYTVTATSPKGSASRQLLLDITAPDPAIIAPVAIDGIVDSLEKAQGITITGTAELGAEVSVLWAGVRKAATMTGTAWSVAFAPNEIAGDSSSVAQVTVRDAAGNLSTASTNITVATTPHVALTKGAELIVTKDMLALSTNETSPTSTGITISGLANGEFRKGGLAVTQFTLQDVEGGLVTFVHDNSVNAPSFNVAVSDGAISSSAKAAQIFFVPTSLAGLDDVLTGTTTADLLIGGDGNDIIRGGQGSDVLYGHGSGLAQGLDNDTFVWGSGDAGLGASDVIRDFSAWNGTSGDRLDLSALLVGYQAGTSDISQWISVQNDATLPGASGWDVGKTGTLLTIDIDGAGAGTVTQTIFLQNASLTTTNVNQLISGGVILP
jgi:hypothetical protein